ncbi:hypothetical protein J0H58_02010 [bacterium]|nr:hypothetical protein [bacterium]
MSKTLQLPDLEREPNSIEFSECDRLWRMVLAMAVRDGASSAHYHPWRANGPLSYVVAGIRYELIPPPPTLARQLAEAVAALAGGNRLIATLRRWFGRPPRASGRVRLIGPDGLTNWAGVVWSAGGALGVEWYRVEAVVG